MSPIAAALKSLIDRLLCLCYKVCIAFELAVKCDVVFLEWRVYTGDLDRDCDLAPWADLRVSSWSWWGMGDLLES